MFRKIRRRSYLDDGEVPLVIMGDASIPVSIRGTVTAPVKYIQELFKRFCEMIYASEFRTSIICSQCGCLTSKCALRGITANGYPNICRGLLYCGGITCRPNQQQLPHRDENGLKCILISLLFRPAILQRGGPKQSLSKMRKIHYISPSLTRRKEELELQAELAGEMIQAFPFDVDMEDADDIASADESSNLSGSEMDSASEVDDDAEEKSFGDDVGEYADDVADDAVSVGTFSASSNVDDDVDMGIFGDNADDVADDAVSVDTFSASSEVDDDMDVEDAFSASSEVDIEMGDEGHYP